MQAIALTLRPLTLGVFCFIAGDMAGGSYPWAAHMPYAAVAVGALLAMADAIEVMRTA